MGFTLIELLVVIAISMILMGLVLYPVAQSFKMTRSAQAMVESQDAARQGMEQISRDLGEAMDVIDYTGEIEIPVLKADDSGVDYIKVPDAKIDFILPKMVVHCNNPDHPEDTPERDFARGDEALPACPVCGSTDVEVRPKLPLEQDTKVVRYFLGLQYNDPNGTDPKFGWLSPWGDNVEAGEGNPVVLYRVEFDPSDTTLLSSQVDAADVTEYGEVGANLRDPKFFYRSDTWQAWRNKARVVGVAKYQDLVDGVNNDEDKDWDELTPCVTFKYKTVDNDTLSGTYSTDKSFEYPDAVPAVYRAQYGYWMPGYGVSVYRYTYDGDGNVSLVTAYMLSGDGSTSFVVDKVEYAHNITDDTWTSSDIGTTFNILQYLTDGTINSNAEMAFTIDRYRGQVRFDIVPEASTETGANGYVCVLNPSTINSRFKTNYTDDRGAARRYDILSTFDDGTDDAVRHAATASNNYLANATVVPGSERVIGPNMISGTNHGKEIMYQRVPYSLGDPGQNQYRIDYDNGYIFFSSVYGQDLPVDGDYEYIHVNYKVHFNREDDVVRGNYSTKAAVVVHLGMRMYDPDAAKPHSVDLSNTIVLRNMQR